MKIKPPNFNPNPRTLKKPRVLSPNYLGHPFQALIQPDLPPDRPREAQLSIAWQPAISDAVVEQLASRVVQAVQAAPLSLDPHKVLITFHSGWLQGVTCAVVVTGGRVRLQLRADGARQRADLLQCKKILSGKLGSAGFDLCGYEVSP